MNEKPEYTPTHNERIWMTVIVILVIIAMAALLAPIGL